MDADHTHDCPLCKGYWLCNRELDECSEDDICYDCMKEQHAALLAACEVGHDEELLFACAGEFRDWAADDTQPLRARLTWQGFADSLLRKDAAEKAAIAKAGGR